MAAESESWPRDAGHKLNGKCPRLECTPQESLGSVPAMVLKQEATHKEAKRSFAAHHTGSWGSRAHPALPSRTSSATPQAGVVEAKNLGWPESPGPAVQLASGHPRTLSPIHTAPRKSMTSKLQP